MDRIVYLDSLRGFAILLVIVGHLIQYNYNTGIDNVIFNIIYSFHMPLFFFLSGCTTWISEVKKGPVTTISDSLNQIRNKFLSLIVPSVVWSMLLPLFFQSEYVSNTSISDYWFLNTLFVVSCIWSLFTYFEHFNRKFVMLILFMSIIFAFTIGIKRISLMYLIMFVLGYYFQRYSVSKKMNNVLMIVMLLIFLVSVRFFDYGDTTFGSSQRVWMELPLSILASCFLIPTFVKLHDSNYKIMNLLTLLGKYSLGIYLCHFLFVKDLPLAFIEINFSSFIQFIILIIIALFIALLCVSIQYIILFIPYLRGFMYGIWRK